MTEGKDLYRLQSLDSERDSKQRRLMEIEAALGESEELKQAHQKVKSTKARVRKWTLQQRDRELESEGLSDKISRSEQKLYSGAIKNPKELTDLQAEVAALRRRQRKLEDNLLEAMIEREEAEAAHAQAQERLAQIQSQWSSRQADLLSEREALQSELAELEQAQAELLPRIESGDLATYRGLRRRKGGVAVVQVRDGACGGCGLAIPPSLEWELRQQGMGYCSNCERIVVRV
jgi:hypothetical protein